MNEKSCKLYELFAKLEKMLNAKVSGDTRAIEVYGVTCDSRKVVNGIIFVACKGSSTDGHRYINETVEKGAAAIVAQEGENIPELKIPFAIVPDSREALVLLLQEFLGKPPKNVHGVTGTNGKTSITHFLWSIFTESNEKAGLIGTNGYAFEDGHHIRLSVTTPGAEELWQIFHAMKIRGIESVAMEVSSHGLDQKRTWGIDFRSATYSGISPEHLDYHKTMEAYFAAKSILFAELSNSAIAMINKDDSYSERMLKIARGNKLTYSMKDISADIFARTISSDINGSHFILATPWGEFKLRTHLPCRFNIYNLAAAAGVALACGYAPENVITALEKHPGVEGRFQQIKLGQPFSVIVDYAHTPEALKNALLACKEIATGRVIVVFGAGGDRDQSKRKTMGECASQIADVIIITSDNPRSEDPLKIIEMISAGIQQGKDFLKIPDRREAIFEAIRMAQSGDIVLVAGKGHEDYQIFSDKTIHFSDAEVIEEAIRSMV